MHRTRPATATRALLVAALAVAVTVSPGSPAAAAPGPASAGAPGVSNSLVHTESVTLVIGDTVAVSTFPGGQRSARLTHVAGRPGGLSATFTSLTTPDGDLYVIPSDAAAALSAHRVDLVDVGSGTPEEIAAHDLRGKIAVLSKPWQDFGFSGTVTETNSDQALAALAPLRDAGARRDPVPEQRGPARLVWDDAGLPGRPGPAHSGADPDPGSRRGHRAAVAADRWRGPGHHPREVARRLQLRAAVRRPRRRGPGLRTREVHVGGQAAE
ncbi:MAG TPA: hypothetical protein VFX70_02390 [Mycobacteriales bacterium]|nr:hypothetical protein [Mycobacteriales bacterium]